MTMKLGGGAVEELGGKNETRRASRTGATQHWQWVFRCRRYSGKLVDQWACALR